MSFLSAPAHKRPGVCKASQSKTLIFILQGLDILGARGTDRPSMQTAPSLADVLSRSQRPRALMHKAQRIAGDARLSSMVTFQGR